MTILKEYRIVLPVEMGELEKARLWHKVEQTKLEMILLQKDDSKMVDYAEKILLSETINRCDVPMFISPNRLVTKEKVEHVIKEYGSVKPPAESSISIKPNTVKDVGVSCHLFPSISDYFDAVFTNSIKLNRIDSWDAYPYFSSVSTSYNLGPRYSMVIEGLVCDGVVSDNNPLQLSYEDLERRQLVVIDIAGDIDAEDYRQSSDPSLMKSTFTGRGSLQPGAWMEEAECYTKFRPVTVCVLVEIRYDCLGPIGRYAEEKLHEGIRRSLLLHYRELFCSIDKWYPLAMTDLELSEQEASKELQDVVNQFFSQDVKEEASTSEPKLVGGQVTCVTQSCCLSMSEFFKDLKWFFCGYFDDRSTVTESSGNSLIIFAVLVGLCMGILLATKIYL